MPIKDGNIVFDRTGLLAGILNRTSVSFSGALNAASQANRDQINLQQSQFTNFLGERRFDRTFKENQFKDRRNFAEDSFRDKRNFGEKVRQFNVNDANVDASRSLQRELGFARLEREDARIGISRDQLSLSNRRFDQSILESNDRIDTNRINREFSQTKLDNFNDTQTEVEEAERYANELFGENYQPLLGETPADTEIEKAGVLAVLKKANSPLYDKYSARIATKNNQNQALINADKDRGAMDSNDLALQDLASGDFVSGIARASDAQALAKETGNTLELNRATNTLQMLQDARKDQLGDTITGPDGKLSPAPVKGDSGQDPFKRTGFTNGADALNVVQRMKKDSGVSELTITNSFGEFASRFNTVEEFRNGIISQAIAEGKGKAVKITLEQAKTLFKAEKFLQLGSTPTNPKATDADADAATNF